MNYYSSTNFRPGPQKTPATIKNLILLTLFITLAAAITNNLVVYLFNIPGPMDWLSLSWWGMKHDFFWQPATYLFTHHTGAEGISFSFILDFSFNMFMLWVFGCDLVTRIGKSSFLKFYFLSGILSGLFTLLLMPLTGQYGVISGAMPPIISMMVLWTLMNPNSILFLFFLIPIKAKWLTFGLIAGMILLSLSKVDLTHFFLYVFATAIGYFYGLLVWDLHSPFPALYKFELAVIRAREKIKDRLKFLPSLFRGKQQKKKKETRMVDFNTGEPIQDDDSFVNAMLEKISRHGERSLTWQEKERMQKISEKRRKEKSDRI